MTKNTNNIECKLHAQPSGENIMILEQEIWENIGLIQKVSFFSLAKCFPYIVVL